ncbi:hypothetical protein HK405_007939, partial [Cladochytrium tenue]
LSVSAAGALLPLRRKRLHGTTELSEASPAAGLWYYEKARSLVPEVVDRPSLAGVQAVLLLALVALELGHRSTAWHRAGMAAVMLTKAVDQKLAEAAAAVAATGDDGATVPDGSSGGGGVLGGRTRRAGRREDADEDDEDDEDDDDGEDDDEDDEDEEANDDEDG